MRLRYSAPAMRGHHGLGDVMKNGAVRSLGKRLFGLAVLSFVVLSGGFANADQFYISLSGSDWSDGRSRASAWRTLGEANRELKAGDSVTISAGTYDEIIAPVNSGTETRNQITYRAETPGTVTVTGGFDLNNKDYVTISGIDIDADFFYVQAQRSSHITVEDSTMSGVDYNPGIDLQDASYVVLRNNHITGSNERYVDLLVLSGNAHHNLVENNYLDQASHALVLLQGSSNFDDTDPRYNIFRGNTYTNDYHHCVTTEYGPHDNVFERETYLRCGSGHVTPKLTVANYSAGIEGEAWHAWQPRGIYRFNLVMNAGSYGLENDHLAAFGGLSSRQPSGRIQRTVDTHVYHNSFVNNYGLVFSLGAFCQNGCAGVQYGGNRFKNNLLAFNAEGNTKFGSTVIKYDFYDAPISDDDVWSGNLIGTGPNQVIMWRGEKYTLDEASSQISVEFSSNHYGDPKFRDARNLDFGLSADSAAVDIGVPLTETISQGSGRDIPVEDAGYFIDGYGIVDGDTIKVGSEVVRITAVDYSRNLLRVDRDIIWQSKAPVNFPYSGSRADAGAKESGLQRPKAPVLALSSHSE